MLDGSGRYGIASRAAPALTYAFNEGNVMSAHFDLKRSGTQFMFNFKAANGEIVLSPL
jgi:hypothetical protein